MTRVNQTSRVGKLFLTVNLLIACTASADGTSNQPALASVSAMVTNAATGDVVVAKHESAVLPIASLTKIMTAYVVLESGEALDEWLPIRNWHTPPAKNAFSRIRIDSKARRRDLLKIALMSSENRASYNLAANHPGGFDAFVHAMNETARALEMNDTRFVDPMGLSPDNQSTAHDLAILAANAHQHATMREFSTTRQHTVNFQKPRYRLGYGNTNPLTGSKRWDVSLTKTGYLKEAGRCLIMVADADGDPMVMVFLNSFGKRSPLGDAGRVRRWMESGTVSNVAPAAKDYERRMIETFGLAPAAGG